jgi:hypothetical protein
MEKETQGRKKIQEISRKLLNIYIFKNHQNVINVESTQVLHDINLIEVCLFHFSIFKCPKVWGFMA